MSCNVEHAIETREPASSQFPEGSDCRNGGQVERTPLQGISSTSKTTEGKSQAEGNRRASELQGSMASGNSGSGSFNPEQKRRKRLSAEQKLEVLELLKSGVKPREVALRYRCRPWTVWHIGRMKNELERKKESPGFNGKAKAEMPIGFPQVEEKVKKMVDDARRMRVPVTRDIIMSFGRVTGTQMLSWSGMSDGQKTRLARFCASDNWAKNFIKRNGYGSKVLHGGAGGVDHEAVKVDIDAIREAASHYTLDNIFIVDETGLFFKVLPKRTYVAKFEGRKTFRGTKDMEAKDRVSAYLSANASGSLKVPISIIGKAVKLRCFRGHEPPAATCFAQKKAWSHSKIFQRWWQEVFLPFIYEKTSGDILLLMDGGKANGDGQLQDSRGRVRIMHLPLNCTSVHQPMDMGVIAATKLHYRKRFLDCKAKQLYEAESLTKQAREDKMKVGTAGLEQGFHPHMRDVAKLLKGAWGDVTDVSIARCWALADILPQQHQQVVQELRKKTNIDGSVDKEKDDPSSGEVAKHLRMLIERVRSCLRLVDNETRAVFEDLGDMLDSLGVKDGSFVSEDALNAVVEWFNLEAREDVASVVELDRQEEVLRNIESNLGYRSDDDLDIICQELGMKSKIPQEVSSAFDTLEEHATLIENPHAQDLLRQLRGSLTPASLDERIGQSGETEISGMVD